MSISKEQWNEPEAIVLLERAGELVAGFELLTAWLSTGTWRPPARHTGRRREEETRREEI